jgi:hypothetical protein
MDRTTGKQSSKPEQDPPKKSQSLQDRFASSSMASAAAVATAAGTYGILITCSSLVGRPGDHGSHTTLGYYTILLYSQRSRIDENAGSSRRAEILRNSRQKH